MENRTWILKILMMFIVYFNNQHIFISNSVYIFYLEFLKPKDLKYWSYLPFNHTDQIITEYVSFSKTIARNLFEMNCQRIPNISFVKVSVISYKIWNVNSLVRFRFHLNLVYILCYMFYFESFMFYISRKRFDYKITMYMYFAC